MMAINLNPFSQENNPEREQNIRRKLSGLWGRSSDTESDDFEGPYNSEPGYDEWGNEIPEDEGNAKESEESESGEGDAQESEAQEKLDQAKETAKDTAKKAVKKKAEAAGEEALAATSEFWVPVAAGCAAIVAVLVIFGIFALAFMAWQNDAKPAEAAEPTTICLDPGHPSENAGATAPNGTGEREMNLMVANDLNQALASAGYMIVMTKTQVDEKIGNKERADKCAAGKADLMYRIHMDEPRGKAGPFHEVPGPKLSNIHDRSLGYAKIIQSSLVKTIGAKSSGPQPIDGGVHNEEDVSGKALEGSIEANAKNLPAVLIEMMTIDNVNVAWLKNSANRAKFVKGISEGIQKAIPPTSSSNTYGAKVIELAKSQMGKPYGWGSCHDWTSHSPPAGCSSYDCSGLVSWAWYWGSEKKFSGGGDTGALCQLKDGKSAQVVKDIKSAQPGDILIWDYQGTCSKPPIHHTGLYVGGGKYIHAPSTGDVVKISNLSSRSETALILRPKIK